MITGIPGFFGANAPIYISKPPFCGALIWCDADGNAPIKGIGIVQELVEIVRINVTAIAIYCAQNIFNPGL